jgi:4-aminobutyrate aminotransferase / (S)-3-amino-2-methylpropionate transaminase / 5-aminovalerate transaminase
MDGTSLPRLFTPIPGPISIGSMDSIARMECPAVTARRARRRDESGVEQDPIVWKDALGSNVRDVDGNIYVDLSSAFGVATLGHRHPSVVAAAHRQLDTLIHAMGDVYPSEAKVLLYERLIRETPNGLDYAMLGSNGSDAVEAALKTAKLHTGKPGILSFTGSYHGLSYGALAATHYKDSFRLPFLSQINPHVTHIPFPDTFRPPPLEDQVVSGGDISEYVLERADQLLRNGGSSGQRIGAVVIEPIQGRGGIRSTPPGFLRALRGLCDVHNAVLIFDEIYTGWWRTGARFACEREGVTPDLLCVGKSMGGGFPISAVIGSEVVMRSWGLSQGEAIHTSTFSGNPLGCAMASAVIDELSGGNWGARIERFGDKMQADLEELAGRYPNLVGDVRGRGMMWGVDLIETERMKQANGRLALELMDRLRQRGYLLLPCGTQGNVLSVTPPFVITDEQWQGFYSSLKLSIEKATQTR